MSMPNGKMRRRRGRPGPRSAEREPWCVERTPASRYRRSKTKVKECVDVVDVVLTARCIARANTS